MAHTHEEAPFTGFGTIRLPKPPTGDVVFILVVYRDGSLSASAHATERGAMDAAAAYLEDERDEEEERSSREDGYARAQQLLADEGGVMEIIAGPVHGS